MHRAIVYWETRDKLLKTQYEQNVKYSAFLQQMECVVRMSAFLVCIVCRLQRYLLIHFGTFYLMSYIVSLFFNYIQSKFGIILTSRFFFYRILDMGLLIIITLFLLMFFFHFIDKKKFVYL